MHPTPVDGAVLVWVAAVGVAVNLVATATLSRANRRSLNVEGAFRHVLTDLYGFLGTMVAGILIVTTGFTRADPLASLVVVGLDAQGRRCSCSGRRCTSCSKRPPRTSTSVEVRRHLLELPEVRSVHDLHAWTLTSSLPILTVHVVVSDECFSSGEAGRVLDHLQGCLAGHFDVAHSTLQLESVGHIEHELGGHA